MADSRPPLGDPEQRRQRREFIRGLGVGSDVVPRITVTSIPSADSTNGDDGPFDHFPNLDPTSTNSRAEAKLVQALKDGDYTPFMQAVEYKGTWSDQWRAFNAQAIHMPGMPRDMRAAAASLRVKGTAAINGAQRVLKQAIVAAGDAALTVGTIAGSESERLRELARMYKNSRVPLRRKYYANPRQYYDHVLLADAYANTFAGEVIDTLVAFIMGRGVFPVLALRRPSGDPDKDAKELEAVHDVLLDIMEIDQWFSDMGPVRQDNWFDTVFQERIRSLVTMCLVFGRAAMAKEYWAHLPRVELDDKPIKMPNVLKIIHPIEMGLTEVELYSGKVAGVWISNDQPYLPMEDMIYIVNNNYSPMIGTHTYGFTRLQRCIDHTRMYRRLLARSLPQYLRVSATGMGAFLMNTTGYPPAVRENIRSNLLNMHRTGEIAVIDYANVDDFDWKEFKINTDIGALVELEKGLLSSISTVLGVPHSIVFDSAESRATLIGRIVSFSNTTVATARESIGNQLAQQWWMPILRTLKKDESDFLKKFTLKTRFVDLSLETKLELVERLLQESELNPYKNSYIGEQLGDPEYEQHIDEKKIEEMKEERRMMMEAKMAGPGGGTDGPQGGAGRNSSRRASSKNGKQIQTKRDGATRRGNLGGG